MLTKVGKSVDDDDQTWLGRGRSCSGQSVLYMRSWLAGACGLGYMTCDIGTTRIKLLAGAEIDLAQRSPEGWGIHLMDELRAPSLDAASVHGLDAEAVMAVQQFSKLRQKNVSATCCCYNHPNTRASLYSETIVRALDERTYSTAIHACANSAKWEHSLALMASIQSAGTR
eukprot:1221669-Amphidinium_carterae.1